MFVYLPPKINHTVKEFLNSITVIVFDLGNVLIPFDYESPLRHFNNLKPGLGDRFAALYKENYHIHREFEKGELSRSSFLEIMIDWLENMISEDEFCKIFSDIFSFNEEVIALLPKLKEKYTLCLLSNTNQIHEEYGYKNYTFMNHFDKLFLSHEVGAIKPEKEIYRAVEKFTQRPSKEHLFIDDVLEYVDGAKSCGWDAVQFVGFEKLISDLKKRNIL
jgi:putative hydrolase of the HAD superfamily